MIDCNKCINLNMTEREQVDKRIPHLCLAYSKRVFHGARSFNHSEYIYPCMKCVDDNYKNFRNREVLKNGR